MWHTKGAHAGNNWRNEIPENLCVKSAPNAPSSCEKEETEHLLTIASKLPMEWRWILKEHCHRWQKLGTLLWSRKQEIINAALPQRNTCTQKVLDCAISRLMTKGTTINSVRYCETLIKPKARIWWVCPDMEQPLLQNDNARPHTSAMTTACIQLPGFDVVDHPPYIPDLAS